MTIGDRLREAREARGLSQNKLSRASGVSLSTINQLEKGVRGQRTGTDVVTKLTATLAVHRAWLETGVGPRDADVPPAVGVRQAREAVAERMIKAARGYLDDDVAYSELLRVSAELEELR